MSGPQYIPDADADHGPLVDVHAQTTHPASSVIFTWTVHSQANGLAHSGLRSSSSVTYFRQQPQQPN